MSAQVEECRWTFEYDDGRPAEGGTLSGMQATAWLRDWATRCTAPQPTISDGASIHDIHVRELASGVRSVDFHVKDAGAGFRAWADAQPKMAPHEATA